MRGMNEVEEGVERGKTSEIAKKKWGNKEVDFIDLND